DVSLAPSCWRLHHHVFSLLQRAHCLLLPQIGNNQPNRKSLTHPPRCCNVVALQWSAREAASSAAGRIRAGRTFSICRFNDLTFQRITRRSPLVSIGIEWSLMGSAT